jgi:acyl-coenzyme A synthetase/AMP-(fatty) acid ligase
VAFGGKFSPEVAFDLLQRHQVTHSFLFPAALKAMMKSYAYPSKLFKLKLKGLMIAGEAVCDAVFNGTLSIDKADVIVIENVVGQSVSGRDFQIRARDTVLS